MLSRSDGAMVKFDGKPLQRADVRGKVKVSRKDRRSAKLLLSLHKGHKDLRQLYQTRSAISLKTGGIFE
jgi:hypothetical protein